MFAKLCLCGVIASFSTVAIATDLPATHERVNVPGKTVNAYRPIAQTSTSAAKCHPDGTKAVACEAMLQHARMEERLSQRKMEADAVQLGSR